MLCSLLAWGEDGIGGGRSDDCGSQLLYYSERADAA